jgi:hypothetical protein
MGDNILSMLRELTGPGSTLPSLAAQGPTAPSRVYASYLGSFINFSALVSGLIYTILLAASLYLLSQASAPTPFLRTVARTTLKDGTELGALIGVNALAALMRALGRPMSFFAVEYSALLLYGPAALGGALGSLLVWSPQRSEHEMWAAGAARAFMGALVLQAAGFGSGVLFAVSAAPVVLVLAAARATGHAGRLPVWAYALGGLGGLVTGTLFTAIVLDIFVPLVCHFPPLSLFCESTEVAGRPAAWEHLCRLTTWLHRLSRFWAPTRSHSSRRSRGDLVGLPSYAVLSCARLRRPLAWLYSARGAHLMHSISDGCSYCTCIMYAFPPGLLNAILLTARRRLLRARRICSSRR